MNLATLKIKYKDQILQIANICMAENIRIFGSILNEQFTEESDIDFLVHMKPNSGFAIGGLKWRLEELLGRSVDVVSDNALHSSIKAEILKQAVSL